MDCRVLSVGVAGVVMAAVLAVPAGADTVAASAVQSGPKISVCTIAGSVSLTPAVSYSPAPIKYTVEGTMSCARSWVGKLSGGGAGTMACEAGKSDASFDVAWKKRQEVHADAVHGRLRLGQRRGRQGQPGRPQRR